MYEHIVDLHSLAREILDQHELSMAVIYWYAKLLGDLGFLVETGLQPPGDIKLYLRWRRPRGRWIGRLLADNECVRLTPHRRLPRGFPGAIEHADPVGYERLERAVLELGEQR